MGDFLLWTDKEVFDLLEKGIRSEVYEKASLTMTKREIEYSVQDYTLYLTVQDAKEICIEKIKNSTVSILDIIQFLHLFWAETRKESRDLNWIARESCLTGKEKAT